MSVYKLGSSVPQIDPTAFIHPDATLIGAISLGRECSVWPQATLRGDTEPIVIGPRSNIQDGSVLHADPGCPLTIGAGVTIGHLVMLHGCVVGNGTLVGIQSVILNRAKIGANCLVGAGSLITEEKEFPDGVLILGRPAKVVRPLTPEEIARLALNADVYVMRGAAYSRDMERVS
jgi:carbonic anhydrase/acetyltransferase-like protein (isoleucine patch superfamily)